MLKDKIKKAAIDVADIPKEVATSLPKLVIMGNEELFCGGYKIIREYSENEVRLSTGRQIISIKGEDLNIKSIENEEIVVHGKIDMVELI